MPGGRDVYVRARRVLLDALEALEEHRAAVILVGAQAVYLRAGDDAAAAPYTADADLAIAPFTSDGDIALDPAILKPRPTLEAAMKAASFELDAAQPGIWWREDIEVDLLVPAALGGPGRRGARLGPHGNRAARKVSGLEAALADSSPMSIASLEPHDARAFEIRVAGAAALLVAKAHKLRDRSGDDDRLAPKDALDVYRLLRSVPRDELVDGFASALSNELARSVTETAIDQIQREFAGGNGDGLALLERAVEGLGVDVALTTESCRILAVDLVDAIRQAR